MQLYEKLTVLRKKHDLTIEHLSELSGVPEGTIAKIMSGNTRNPSFDNVVDILTAMGEQITAVVDDLPAESPCIHVHGGDGTHHPLCDHCPSLNASRTSYTHAYTELKHHFHIVERWITVLALYAIVITIVITYMSLK